MEKNITVVTGGRADYGLLEPVIERLNEECNLTVLVTGSHLSHQFGYTADNINQKYNLVYAPCLVDYDEPIGVCMSMSNLFSPVATMLLNTQADGVVLLGDRYEIFAAAIAAYNLQIPIHHIQGGDITTGSLDDGYRDCITRLATHHYVATSHARDEIVTWRENYDDVYTVGSLACVLPEIEANDEYEVICAVHPSKDNIAAELIGELTEHDSKTLFVGSNADAGGGDVNQIIQMVVEHKPDTFVYEPSLTREEYLSYLKGAKVLIGNSSSGIFEAPVVRTPSINIGTRQQGRLRGKSVMQVDDMNELRWAFSFANDIKEFDCPYYKPNTVERIVEGILS